MSASRKVVGTQVFSSRVLSIYGRGVGGFLETEVRRRDAMTKSDDLAMFVAGRWLDVLQGEAAGRIGCSTRGSGRASISGLVR